MYIQFLIKPLLVFYNLLYIFTIEKKIIIINNKIKKKNLREKIIYWLI
jgi:ssDNA-specific exonuclease RecJ